MQIPYKFLPRKYQTNLLRKMDEGCTRAIWVVHRRAGKDKTCWNYMIKRAFERIGTYFYFLPTYSQAKKVIWDNIDSDGFKMLEHIPKELIRSTNATELKIELINGSVIQLIGADEFKRSGVGTNPIGVVFSEYSITSPEAWKYVSPILAANGGWAIFNFTPRGMNHAWELLQKAEQNEQWFTEVLTVADTGALSPEILEEERKNMPQDLFDQEYYCKFLDGAGQFFRNFDVIEPIERIEPFHKFRLGVDLAKYQDFTVLTPFNLNTFNVHKQFRFNNIDYTAQKARIEAEYFKHNKPLTRLDSTGVGEPIHDDLANKGINIEPYHFTEQSRKDLLTNLQLLLEQRKIRIPDDPILIGELRSFRYTLTETGRTKIQVPEGIHDDTVFSLALAVWDCPMNPLRTNTNSLLNLTSYAKNDTNTNSSYE